MDELIKAAAEAYAATHHIESEKEMIVSEYTHWANKIISDLNLVEVPQGEDDEAIIDKFWKSDLKIAVTKALAIGRSDDKWIKVEKPPNEYDTVLIYNAGCSYSAIYLKGGFEDEDGNTVYNHVTHWQPLPEPPKT